MPELPEVETIVRRLAPLVRGSLVLDASVSWVRSVGGIDPAAFRELVLGTRISGVHRIAKYLIFDLLRGDLDAGVLVCHLRMSGRLHVEPEDTPRSPWCRVALALDGQRELRFVDVRKFGRLVHAPAAASVLPPLGPDALDPTLDARTFARRLASRRRALKPLLLDQAFIAGLGNIYVDESLHRAGLHPARRSDRVTRAQGQRLLVVIRETVREAIRCEGSSFDTFYRTPEGRPGAFQDQFEVYGRTGLPCRTCGRPIRRIVIGQRGTHLCTACQPAPRPRARLAGTG